MSKIDLQNSRWCQMVFEGRNREYGAYALRRDYSRRALKALLIAVLSFTFFAYAPILAARIGKNDNFPGPVPDTGIKMAVVETPRPQAPPPPKMELPPPPAVKELRYTTPEVVPQQELNDDDLPPAAETIPDDVLLGSQTKDGLSKFEVPIDAPGNGTGREIITGRVTDDVYDYAAIQKKPVFPGGMDKLLPYITKHVRFPAEAVQNNIYGTVFVQFTIDRDGSVTDVRAVRGTHLGGGLAEEAVRVVKSMPRWEPGEQNGRKVKVSYTIPVAYRLRQ